METTWMPSGYQNQACGCYNDAGQFCENCEHLRSDYDAAVPKTPATGDDASDSAARPIGCGSESAAASECS